MKLLCPVCGKPLKKVEKAAVCENGHSYDYARQGYLNLYLKQSVDHGDNKAMVQARTAFLSTGSYAFLKDRLVEKVKEARPCVLVDLGCGEGWYTRDLPADEKYGFDLSKEALKHAARIDPAGQYAVASIFHLPLPDECADAVLTCFAPAAEEEIVRILKPGGIFLFVTPGPDHLMEMKKVLYDVPYQNELKDLGIQMTLKDTETIEHSFHVNQDNLMNLFEMTPYAHRTPAEAIERLRKLDGMDLTAQFVIRTYQK